jgi:hypothetical protein
LGVIPLLCSNVEAPRPVIFSCRRRSPRRPRLFGPTGGHHALSKNLRTGAGVGIVADRQRPRVPTTRGNADTADTTPRTGREGRRSDVAAQSAYRWSRWRLEIRIGQALLHRRLGLSRRCTGLHPDRLTAPGESQGQSSDPHGADTTCPHPRHHSLSSILLGRSHRTRFSQVFRHSPWYGHDLDPSLSQALAFYSLPQARFTLAAAADGAHSAVQFGICIKDLGRTELPFPWPDWYSLPPAA